MSDKQVDDPAEPSVTYPHPDCDSACHYHCTEAGAHAPKCARQAVQVQDDAWGVLHKPSGKWVQDHDGRVHLLSEQNAKNICINDEYEARRLRIEICERSPVATTAPRRDAPQQIRKWQDRYAGLGSAPNELVAERRKGACRDAEIADLRAALVQKAPPAKDEVWYDATELPLDSRQVLVEFKPRRRNSAPVYGVANYFRTEKGVHDEASGWFDDEGDKCNVVHWKYIDAPVAPQRGN